MLTRLLALGLVLCLGAAQGAVLFPANSTWRLQRGTNEASFPDLTAWRTLSFADTNFAPAPAPFWYGDVRPGGTQLTDMVNAYSCLFLRQAINVPNGATVRRLRLNYFIDDGFILWVNGNEVFRENVAGAPTFTTLAANQPIDPAPPSTFTFNVPAGTFLNGSNLIAIQVFNTALASTDLGFDCAIEAFFDEATPPTVAAVNPLPGATVSTLTQVAVTFSENVTGVNADDLLVNSLAATSVTGSGSNYIFQFSQPAGGSVFISWNPAHGIADEAFSANAFDASGPGATWSYNLIDNVRPTVTGLYPSSGATVRTLQRLEVTFSEEVAGVNATDLQVNGQSVSNLFRIPGGPYVFDFPEPAPGIVTVQWSSNHAIIDLASNPFLGGSWTYRLDPEAPQPKLVINELMAANENGLLDEDGQPQDWIEIHNQGTNAVDLANWALTDDPAVPGLWVFPPRILQPNSYLVLFASGLNRAAPPITNRFHTNFRLAIAGEYLALMSPDSPRQVVDGFGPAFPEQRNDRSFGRDANGQLRYFETPTPGAPNGLSSIVGVVEPVHFSSTRGHYSQPFNLVLSCATPGAQIRYSLDGSVPTPLTAAAYNGPLRVTNSQFMRAVAFRTNHLPSTVASHSFLFNQSSAIRSLPVLSIQTASNNYTGPAGLVGMNPSTWSPAESPFAFTGSNEYHNPTKTGLGWERSMSVELIQTNDNSGFQIDCGMRVQGSDYTRPRYQSTSKFSYRLYFRGDYGSSRLEYPFFPDSAVRNFDQIVLRAGHNDISNPFLVDELMRQLSADMGQVAVHGNWVALFINGVYKGYYNPCERVEETFLQNWHGGGELWDIITVGSAVQAGDAVEWNSLRTYANNNNPTQPAVFTELARRLDVVNFIDYLMLNAYGATWDWPHNNWRAARERAPGGKYRFYVWDAEGAFGENGGGNRAPSGFDSFSTTDSGLLTSGAEIPSLYRRLTNSYEFRLLWADRVQKHFFNSGALTDSNVANRFIQMRAELAGMIPSMDSSTLTAWVPQRRAPMLMQFGLYDLLASSNAPVFNQHGGRVPPGFNLTMTAPYGGSIYYTSNGDDPRVPFTGSVSNAATLHLPPLTLSQSVRIKARTLSGTNWSALTEALFEGGTLGAPLRVAEIMYNPIGGGLYEFIELQNQSGAVLDLSYVRVLDAITYTFPLGSSLAPGARLVLASDTDPSAWALRYPSVPVAGYFSGSLGNGGERITLRDAAGHIIQTVDYRDAAGWPIAADGTGYSLELNDAFGDADDPANWRASAAFNGTPGTGSVLPLPPEVRLNEVLALNSNAVNHAGTRPDFVELYNAGSAVDLAGWSIGDNGIPGQFIFPPGTSLASGGYLVVFFDAPLPATPGLHTGFELDPDGDAVFLFDASNNRVDAVSFGRQIADRSLGRINGTWKLNLVTTNAPNLAAPLAPAGDVSLNEWMANPLPGLPDWIELYNRNSALPAALQGMYLSSTSGVHRIALHSFLPPLGYLQLFADEAVGPDHLDFKLSAAGGTLSLYNNAAVLVQNVSYGPMAEGVSQGFLPDGSLTLASFPNTASPEARNFATGWTGPVLNEILARNVHAITNAGRVPDFVELFNSSLTAFSLAGLSLSVGSADAGQWTFPPGASLPASSYLLVWCDGGRPASTNAGDYNTGRSLDGNSGSVALFNTNGQPVSSVAYGPQVVDLSMGLISGQWRLLQTPTPGAANAAVATLGQPGVLKLNEWMAAPVSGADWLELYNPTNLPIDLTGLLLTDDLSASGTNVFRVPALSFIGARGFARYLADGDPEQGPDHLPFSLDALGESLRLYATNGMTNIDSVTFGPQGLGVAEGRLLDGASNIVRFPGSATPGGPNYAVALGIVINEVLTHTDPPLEDAVELFNPGPSLAIGGWFLSNSEDEFKKYRLPIPTTLPARGFLVLGQSQFSTGPNAFAFSSAHGDQVWLSEADAAGNLTGQRVRASLGAAFNGVAFGRYPTSLGTDYPALTTRTLGQSNTAPRVGPIVIHEIMYQPPPVGPGSEDEYIELFNAASTNVALFNPAHPASTWKLSGGVEFAFPANATLTPGAYALVVNFDPADAAARLAFQNRNGVSPVIPIFGPYSGKLDNAGDAIDLLQPDTPQPAGAPDAGFVPYVVVDRVHYGATPPWPSGAVAGGGLSLQRAGPGLYGNEGLNWRGAPPTPGQANGAGLFPPPVITTHPQSQLSFEGYAPSLTAAATSAGPLTWQWRLNGIPIPDATNSTLAFGYAVAADTGSYDAIASNPGGSALSLPAYLRVAVLPEILIAPTNLFLFPGTNATFAVVARGDALTYQWRKNSLSLPGATNASLLLTNIQLADDGFYDVLVSNDVGMSLSGALLSVLIVPVLTQEPVSQTVVVGGTVTLSATYTGNPPSFTNEWRRQSLGLRTNVTSRFTDFFTFTATNVPMTNRYRIFIRHRAWPSGTFSALAEVVTLADADGDGIPDEWETRYGLLPNDPADRDLDSDHDGLSNWKEYIAGTDPVDDLDYLRVDLSVLPGQASVVFNAISNKTYTVQYTDQPGVPWSRLADFSARLTNRVVTVPDPVWTTNRIYRLITPGVP